MLKASWGGGGRGMRVIESDAQLTELLPVARREAKAASATTRSISRSWCARRGTSKCRSSATRTATSCILFERDCTVQRRNQKVVERATRRPS
jgi:pyruvate carboxylase